MDLILLDSQAATWGAEIDRAYATLGGADNPYLFPYHFLCSTFPRIGGHVVLLCQGDVTIGICFLFPRILAGASYSLLAGYTLRYHSLANAAPLDATAIRPMLGMHLRVSERVVDLYNYNPNAPHDFRPTHHTVGNVDIGRPDAAEALAIRILQQQVWGSGPGALYPADIHSVEFGLGTSLVARINQQPVGFLLGFDKFDGYPLPADWHDRFGGDWRIESQTLGVLPEYRGARLGFLLKQRQAELALQRGIQIINWTVDPLQWPNALLNFGRLRAIAFDFMPDYYPAFRNALNRLPASRFGLTWLVGAPRVQQALVTPSSTVKLIDLNDHPMIIQVNQDWSTINYQADAAQIAIEIPANWTALQRDDFAAAEQWRQVTDALFQHYIGKQPGQYAVTDVAVAGDKRYLVAERVNDALWSRLADNP
jgi:predicted GNAT superfamily acetyltransferase